MTYKWAIVRNGVLLDRSVNRAGAMKRAAAYTGAVAMAFVFVAGCVNPQHGGIAIPCDKDNCGKAPLDKRP